MSNILYITYKKTGYYASFYEKPSLPLITIHAGLIYASGIFPANIVSVIEKYYILDVEKKKFSVPTIPKKDV